MKWVRDESFETNKRGDQIVGNGEKFDIVFEALDGDERAALIGKDFDLVMQYCSTGEARLHKKWFKSKITAKFTLCDDLVFKDVRVSRVDESFSAAYPIQSMFRCMRHGKEYGRTGTIIIK